MWRPLQCTQGLKGLSHDTRTCQRFSPCTITLKRYRWSKCEGLFLSSELWFTTLPPHPPLVFPPQTASPPPPWASSVRHSRSWRADYCHSSLLVRNPETLRSEIGSLRPASVHGSIPRRDATFQRLGKKRKKEKKRKKKTRQLTAFHNVVAVFCLVCLFDFYCKLSFIHYIHYILICI